MRNLRYKTNNKRQNNFCRLLFFTSCLLFFTSCLSYATWYSAELLSLSAGPRANSMGSAHTAVADGAFATWWNPAGIVRNDESYIAFMQMRLFGMENFSLINIGYPAKKFTVSFLAAYLKIDEIQKLPENLVAEPIGFFEDQELVFFLSSAYKMRKNIEAGVNIKYLSYNLDDAQAQGFGVDIGVNTKLNNIPIGFVVKDIGGTYLKWNTGQRDCKRINLVVGSMYSFDDLSLEDYYLPGSLLFSADIGYEYKPFYGIGVEYSFEDMLFLRTGFSGKSNSLGAGVGIKIRKIAIDYSFSSHTLGATHQISASISFGKVTSRSEKQYRSKTRKIRKSTRKVR